ncbi:hypothetical protein PIB30_067074 [Stylosanthes scabra]|uniref:Uncharacterized protein n=1 Tax=Stylosanthes scabra TaxID=79078 RepID=A0ABU6ZL90_9FABA|nr:hypothetical protein [Stylosanthes scabra]
MGARSEQFLEPLVVLVQSFPVELCNSGDFLPDSIRLGRLKVLFQEPLLEVQRERQSESFHCVVITTGPSSGGTDNLKVLNVLDGVFTRSATEFRQKVYQSGLEFKVGIQFRKSVGLVVESCAHTTQLFES